MHQPNHSSLALLVTVALAILVGGLSVALYAQRAPCDTGAGGALMHVASGPGDEAPPRSLLCADASEVHTYRLEPVGSVSIEARGPAAAGDGLGRGVELAPLGGPDRTPTARTILATYGLGLREAARSPARPWLAVLLASGLLAGVAVLGAHRGGRRRTRRVALAVLAAAAAALLLGWCAGRLGDDAGPAKTTATARAGHDRAGAPGLPAVGAGGALGYGAGAAARDGSGNGLPPGHVGTRVAGDGPRVAVGARGAPGAAAYRWGPVSAAAPYLGAPGPRGIALRSDDGPGLLLLAAADDGGSGGGRPPGEPPGPPQHPVPEPGAALLFAAGLALTGRRLRRAQPA